MTNFEYLLITSLQVQEAQHSIKKKLPEMMQTIKKSCKLADEDRGKKLAVYKKGGLTDFPDRAKGSLPDVPSIKNRQHCIPGGTNGEECPSPAAFLTRHAVRLCICACRKCRLIFAIGRGASDSSSSLGRCLAIPDTQGRGA